MSLTSMPSYDTFLRSSSVSNFMFFGSVIGEVCVSAVPFSALFSVLAGADAVAVESARMRDERSRFVDDTFRLPLSSFPFR